MFPHLCANDIKTIRPTSVIGCVHKFDPGRGWWVLVGEELVSSVPSVGWEVNFRSCMERIKCCMHVETTFSHLDRGSSIL